MSFMGHVAEFSKSEEGKGLTSKISLLLDPDMQAGLFPPGPQRQRPPPFR